MSKAALKKLADSSKVLLFLVYAAGLSALFYIGLKMGDPVSTEVFMGKLEWGFTVVTGGYSVVEMMRLWKDGKVTAAQLAADPAKAMLEAGVAIKLESEAKTDAS